MSSERVTEIHPSCKNKRLRGIGHKTSVGLDTRKSNFGSQWWLQFHI